MAEITSVATHQLKADTQAVLLLCGRLGQQPSSEAKPLTQSEYERVAEWLRQKGLRPSSLLTDEGLQKLEAAGLALPVSFSRLKLLLERGGALALAVESWSNKGLWVISRSDESYPQRLRERRLGPPLLYGSGDPALLEQGGLAVIGSRDAHDAEIAYTTRVSQACVRYGIQIVSGGARGIDTVAIQAALEAGGTAVGVLADSLLKSTVSKKHRDGLKQGRLTLVSPYDPMSGFDVGKAMSRNKFIYALADYALVVTASAGQGGTWTGAIEALKAGGRPVFVRATEDVPEGNRRLLEKGAKPFPTEPWDNIAELLASNVPTDSVKLPMDMLYTPPESQRSTVQLEQQPPAHSTVATTEISADPEISQSTVGRNTRESIYNAVLPLLLDHLNVPMDVKTLAESLQVRQSQLQDWLDEAVEEGAITKMTRPVRYISAVRPQLDLR